MIKAMERIALKALVTIVEKGLTKCFSLTVKNLAKFCPPDVFQARLGNIVEIEREQALPEIVSITQFRSSKFF